MSRWRSRVGREAAEGMLAYASAARIAAEERVSWRELDGFCLQQGILPERYLKNGFSAERQNRLFHSCVGVIGLGGLGGFVSQELARLGVGTFVLADGDCFEPSNLNRQLYATPLSLGAVKAAAAAQSLELLNPSVNVKLAEGFFSSENCSLFSQCDCVVDALDTAESRLELYACCGRLRIPMIHGAVSGDYGQVSVPDPASGAFAGFYTSRSEKRPLSAAPVFTPALIASLQVREVCRLLFGQPTPLWDKMLMVNLKKMEFFILDL